MVIENRNYRYPIEIYCKMIRVIYVFHGFIKSVYDLPNNKNQVHRFLYKTENFLW